MDWQTPPSQPIYVTVAPEQAQAETPGTTVVDVLLGSLGIAGLLLLASLVLGVLLAGVLIRWHRRHPPEAGHLPPVSPLVPGSDNPPSSQAQ